MSFKKDTVKLEKATSEEADAAALSPVLDDVALTYLRNVVNGDIVVSGNVDEGIVCKESDTGDRRCAGFACDFNIQCFS